MQVIGDKQLYCPLEVILWMVYCFFNKSLKVWDLSFGKLATHSYSKKGQKRDILPHTYSA